MNQKVIPLLVIGGLGAAWYLASKSNTANHLRILFQNLKVGKMNGFNLPPIEVNFKIINPTSSPLSIQSIVGDIYINDKKVSTISQMAPVTIPANNVIVYSIKLETGIMQAVYSLLQIIREGKKFVVKFAGSANSSGFNIPINQTVIQL